MQSFNPYMANWEYVPDGEPHVFGDRLYVFGSHDRFGGEAYCENDYVGWSAPVDDLGNWRYEGIIYRKDQDPENADGVLRMNAPDAAQGPDGRYYLYYFYNGNRSFIGVAVCDTPAGKYEYYGKVHHPDSTLYGQGDGDPFMFDPGVLADDDGQVYLYTGFSPMPFRRTADVFGEGRRVDGGYAVRLASDMLTVLTEPVMTAPGVDTPHLGGFEGHEFFEASSMRKANGRYYFVYSTINSHELCYATSDGPLGPFTYGGTLVSTGDIYEAGDDFKNGVAPMGNTHGGMVEVNGQWYIFYHRQTDLTQYSRQACAEKIFIREDGSIAPAEVTSCGLNDGPLAGQGTYGAYIACNLRGKRGIQFYPMGRCDAEDYPYMTQEGSDRENTPNQYIANLCDGAMAGFKYFNLNGTSRIKIVLRGKASRTVAVQTSLDDAPVAVIPVAVDGDWTSFSAAMAVKDGTAALYFLFRMDGACDMKEFTLC